MKSEEINKFVGKKVKVYFYKDVQPSDPIEGIFTGKQERERYIFQNELGEVWLLKKSYIKKIEVI